MQAKKIDTHISLLLKFPPHLCVKISVCLLINLGQQQLSIRLFQGCYYTPSSSILKATYLYVYMENNIRLSFELPITFTCIRRGIQVT